MLTRPLSNFQYTIFDSDGTIFDSMPLYGQTFADLLKESHGVDPSISLTYFRRTAGLALPSQFADLLQNHGYKYELTSPQIKSLVQKFFERVASQMPRLIPGAKEVLEKLRSGLKPYYRLFLFSGTDTRILEERVAKLDINYFHLIFGADVILKGPEHIAAFARATREGLDDFCQKTVIISDGPTDMQLARELKIYAIGITTTVSEDALRHAGANEIIHSLLELV